jgi:hypothetical protein
VSALEAAAGGGGDVAAGADGGLSASLASKRKQLSKVEARLNEVKDRLFADFRCEG